MPTGVIVNALAVLIGGIVGGVGGKYLSEKFKTEINMIFGLASMTMGIIAIAPTKNMAAVIFALIIGTAVGLLLHVSAWINRGAFQMQRIIARFVPANKTLSEEEFSASLLTVIVLFGSSGTGIYGAYVNGMTG